MTGPVLLWVFGLTFIGAACNTPAWLRLTFDAFRQPMTWRIRAVRLGVALVNLGTLAGCWVRGSQVQLMPELSLDRVPVVVGLHRDFSPVFITLRPQFIPAYLSLICAGEILMLLASADALNAAGKTRVCLVAFAIMAPLWTIYVGVRS